MPEEIPEKPFSSDDLSWRDDRTPVSNRFGDVYFSVQDGLAESRHVFLDGCDLPQSWQGKNLFTIGETGFGTGLNFLAAWDLWRQTSPGDDAWLDFVSVELYPLNRDDLARALACWPMLGDLADQLLAAWPDLAPGFHRLVFARDRVRLTLLIGDAAAMFGQLSARVDAWFLDGFSPARNPDMWCPAVFQQLARLSAPGARLASFTVARLVRDGLAEAGFAVEKARGFGRKRDMIRAIYTGPTSYPVPLSPRTVAIVGGGIAGAAMAAALVARGCRVTVFDRDANPASGASGNPVGLVMPKLQLGDAAMAVFHRAAFRLIHQLYQGRNAPASGVLQLASDDAAARRLEKLCAEPYLAESEARFVAPDQANDLAGMAVNKAGLWLETAGWVSPPKLIRHLLAGAAWHGSQTIADLPKEFDLVVIAAGLGSLSHPALCHLPLRPRKGQISRLQPTAQTAALRCCVTEGRYLSPVIDGAHVLGATFDPVGVDEEILATAEADQRNLDNLARMMPFLDRDAMTIIGHRAGVRATTPDHLPIVGMVTANVAVLTGLGSSGLTTAPLCAEILAANLFGAVMPVPMAIAEKLLPGRFGPG